MTASLCPTRDSFAAAKKPGTGFGRGGAFLFCGDADFRPLIPVS